MIEILNSICSQLQQSSGSLELCGLDLSFYHGELDVEFSRDGKPDNVYICTDDGTTKNMVYPQVSCNYIYYKRAHSSLLLFHLISQSHNSWPCISSLLMKIITENMNWEICLATIKNENHLFLGHVCRHRLLNANTGNVIMLLTDFLLIL